MNNFEIKTQHFKDYLLYIEKLRNDSNYDQVINI
jgi:hypothetical protein